MAPGAVPADLHAAPPAFVGDAAVDANERIEPLHGEPTSNSLAEEKQGRRRRRRRGGRGGEGQEGDTGADEAQGQDAAEAIADAPAADADAAAAPSAPVDAEADDQGEGHSQEEGRRRRRRGPRRERGADEAQPVDGSDASVAVAETAPQQLTLSDAPAASPVPPQGAEPIVVAAEPVAPAPVAPAAFVLPLNDLQQLAQGAGLNWVHSDADKVAAAQAAIAAEPKPVRVPRERPPLVVLDEGPLILVETKKDLSQVKLPFDQ